jgi:hypothetical protein
MNMPNFLVIGSIRSGTTALYEFLRQHPRVYLTPQKETNFFAFEGEKPRFRGPGDRTIFNRDTITDIQSYCKQFEGVTTETAIGEVCPKYLFYSRAAERIYHHIPKAKLIAILRNPVDRAYSHFIMRLRDGFEPCSRFEDAIADEDRRIRENWGSGMYVQVGFYGRQLKKYYDTFPKEQIRVYLYEDYLADAAKIIGDLFRFIGVDGTFLPDISGRHNVSGIIKNRVYRLLWTRTHPIRSVIRPILSKGLRHAVSSFFVNQALVRPPFPMHVREQLIDTYREDILMLQDFIGRDLTHWMRLASP